MMVEPAYGEIYTVSQYCQAEGTYQVVDTCLFRFLFAFLLTDSMFLVSVTLVLLY